MADLETAYYASKEKNDDPCYFSEELAVTSRYSKFKTVAVLDYADNFFNRASSIVSSIKFDKDDDFFATAGVTKKIRIFQYSDVVRDYRQWRDGFVTARNLIPFELTESGDGDDTVMPTEDGVVTIDSESENQEGRDHVPRYPILEMSCNSKIRYIRSCLVRLICRVCWRSLTVASLTIRLSNLTSHQRTMKAVSVSGTPQLEPELYDMRSMRSAHGQLTFATQSLLDSRVAEMTAKVYYYLLS